MKKILTFVIMAFLMGGFVLSANAQNTLNFKNKSKKAVVKNPQVTGEDWNKVLTDYENAVENCLNVYNAMQNKDNSIKANSDEFERYLNQAETLKNKLEKAKASLNRTQVNRFNKATQKLSKVYQK